MGRGEGLGCGKCLVCVRACVRACVRKEVNMVGHPTIAGVPHLIILYIPLVAGGGGTYYWGVK